MAEKINLLFIGDIVGTPGMNAIREHLKHFIDKYEANLVVVNGENVSGGKGLTEEEANELFALGADIITTGNHIWDNWKSKPLLANNDKVLRPYNYPPGNVGRGYKIYKTKNNIDVAVVQVQGRTFMQMIDCPFRAMDHILNQIGDKTKVIMVDFHADATAEKMAMGWHLDGRVSALLGTHTHIQTADASILPNGTAYLTDVGMTGPYDSVVGMRKDIALKRFITQIAHKFEMAENDVRISGVFVSIDSETGQAMTIEPFVHPKFQRSVYEEL